MRIAASMAALAVALTASAAAHAQTVIPGLFDTGVSSTGVPQSNGSAELHYALASSPVGSAYALRTADASNGYPIGPWIGDDALSSWIGPVSDGQLDGAAGVYDYRTTFALAGFDAATASIRGLWSTDDRGVDILINGVSTGSSANGYRSFSPFSISSGFVSGLNTIDFLVDNGGGPTGLRVEMTGVASAVPEPGTWALMALGFGMVGFGLRSRRRTAVATA